MTPENPLKQSTQEKPLNLLNGRLVLVEIGEGIWAYQMGEGAENQQFAIDNSGRVVATKQGKDVFLTKGDIGWIMTVKKLEEGLLLSGSYGFGEGNMTLKNIYVIDDKRGRVVSLSHPVSGTTIPLLELKQQQGKIVLIPVRRTKNAVGGVIVTSTKKLMNPQNRGRINGFFATRK